MPKRILLGLSESLHGRSAAEVALAWAAHHGASLLAVGVVDEQTVAPPESVPLGADHYKVERDETLLAAARERMRELLARFEARAQAAGVPVMALDRAGRPAEVLAREAQRADVIVVGTRSGDDAAASTETLSHLLPHAPRPVLCVPAAPPPGEGVLVAYDGSLQAARALAAWTGLGAWPAADLHVLAVERQPGELGPALARAEEYLMAHRERVATIAERTDGAVADALLAVVERLHPAVLVMGAYGRSRLADFFLGSVTRRLLAEMPVPLCLFH